MLRSAVLVAVAVFMILGSVSKELIAQPESTSLTVSALENRVHIFFDSLSENIMPTKEVYQDLLSQSPLFQQAESLNELIVRTDAIPDKYGAFRKYEKIEAKQYGDDLVFLRYFYKCENYPLIWTFWFYRTPSRSDATSGTVNSTEWRVISLRFDNDLRLLELGR